ncbi:hypothetical protein FHR87_003701 [Azomonas macrocytogenes]|uniref:Uncharacterized protein n=1 Tax=Azomonas macrocytogenes TaxID=69962 RepID=A0A839TB37_AZOMA|nr:hypothetical protein [Azomonas macrocytogenes]
MSTNSAKPALATKADPLSILKRWERGEIDARAVPTNDTSDLNHHQLRRLWALLNSPSSPGVINFPLPR